MGKEMLKSGQQKVRTLALLAYSVARHNPYRPSRTTYWDECGDEEFRTLVDGHLTNPDDEERREIRSALKKHSISTVLDVGCGPATEYRSYQQNGQLENVSYFGVDRSERMVRIAKDTTDSPIVRCDLETLPFIDDSFDAVVLRHVLEHQPDGYEISIREAVRVASKCVVIDFFHKPLPIIPGVLKINDKSGYANNWYNQGDLERFLDSLPLQTWGKTVTTGSAGQEAAVYCLNL